MTAKAAQRPQVAVRGAFEADRQEFVRKGGANWLIAASLRWNLFDGSATRARIAEALRKRGRPGDERAAEALLWTIEQEAKR